MTFRTRILLACLIMAIAPLSIFALGARREVRQRLTVQFKERVFASSRVVENDLSRQAESIDTRIEALGQQIDSNAELRATLVQRSDRGLLLDYAPSAMPTTGLDYLLLLDGAGTVLSSGHFRNDYDRPMPSLPLLLAADGPVLVATRRPEGSFVALVRAHDFVVGDRRFVLAGGIEVDPDLLRDLAGDAAQTLAVSLEYPGGQLASDDNTAPTPTQDAIRQHVAIPFTDDVAGAGESANAQWTIAHSLAPLRAVQRRVDAWLLGAVALALLLAVIGARLLAARVNRPLEELAGKASRVDLDQLNVAFETRRHDEIGTLSRKLDAMVRRLRTSAAQLRVAERRATVGDMARQVNHDVRNGLLPIRNVIHHLAEVAETTPAQLGSVFTERAETLRGGVAYLEKLATSYARLSSPGRPQVCDVNAVIHDAVQDFPAERARVQLEMAREPLRVSADPVALRRVVDNLTTNALESLADGNGRVTVATSIDNGGAERLITIRIADTGGGIDPATLDRIFEDFYTTKENGTGLGLTIVRRLVSDMDGRIRVESQPGEGTTFRVELPEA